MSRELRLAKNMFHASWAIKVAPFALFGLMAFSGKAVAQTKAGTSSTKATPKTSSAAKSGTKAAGRTAKGSAKKSTPKQRAQTAPMRDRIVEIQEALAREGFYTGTPNGQWDAQTTVAMSKFQTANGLTPTGKLGALSLQKLGLGSEIAGKAAPDPQADPRPSVLKQSELNDPTPPEAKEQ